MNEIKDLIKKAVAYIRVSTKSDDQLHSYDSQDEYWRGAIENKEGYTFVGLYADKGISGKRQRNRKEFNSMITAAKAGEFNTIFVKSVSRFGRNAEEIMRTVRELREYNVNVVFECENINTSTTTSELYLSIAAALAEDAVRTNGDNMRWSMRRRFAEGMLFVGNGIYGYRKKNGTLVIQENEAEVVRLIFNMYLAGHGLQSIAFELTSRGIPNKHGRTKWAQATISDMLRNEKYCGDSLSQKSVIINGRAFCNADQSYADQYFMENSHPAIVSKEVFSRVQALRIERRTKHPVPPAPAEDYFFKSKIFCGKCGQGYTHKINNPGKKWANGMWVCGTYHRRGASGCPYHTIYDTALEAAFITAYNKFVDTKAQYLAPAATMQEKARLLGDERKLKALEVKRLISKEEYEKEHAQILGKIRNLEADIKKQTVGALVNKAAKHITEITPEAVGFLSRAVILNNEIRLDFVNGFEVTLCYSNGQSGNKKGWLEEKRRNQENEQNKESA